VPERQALPEPPELLQVSPGSEPAAQRGQGVAVLPLQERPKPEQREESKTPAAR
jgi:hypothetical protein